MDNAELSAMMAEKIAHLESANRELKAHLVAMDQTVVEAEMTVAQAEALLEQRTIFFEHGVGSWRQEVDDLETLLKAEKEKNAALAEDNERLRSLMEE